MADSLEEIAVAFCRECLLWRKPEISGTSRTELMWVKAPGGIRFLRFTDLNAVMEAVRAWVANHILSIELENDGWAACVGTTDDYGHVSLGSASNTNLCHALLTACVRANRKIAA